MFINICTNYTKSSCIIRLTFTKFVFARNHIKINPGTINTFYHTFCTKDCTIIFCITENLKDFFNSCSVKFMWSFLTPACKYIICMMMSVMVVVMASAGAAFTVVVVIAAGMPFTAFGVGPAVDAEIDRMSKEMF